MAHLQKHGSPSNAHLATVFNGKCWSTVHSVEITAYLSDATKTITPLEGFTPKDVSTRLMQASGAIYLLMNRINTETIRLVGR